MKCAFFENIKPQEAWDKLLKNESARIYTKSGQVFYALGDAQRISGMDDYADKVVLVKITFDSSRLSGARQFQYWNFCESQSNCPPPTIFQNHQDIDLEESEFFHWTNMSDVADVYELVTRLEEEYDKRGTMSSQVVNELIAKLAETLPIYS